MLDKRMFFRGFAIGILLFGIFAYYSIKNLSEKATVPLDSLSVMSLDGKPVEMSRFKGKPLVVNFWATWCGPCVAELPHFQKVNDELGGEVQFVMISDEKSDIVKKFLSGKPYTFNFLISKVSLKRYGIWSIPVTCIYDAKGNIVDCHTGGMDENQLRQLIHQSLK